MLVADCQNSGVEGKTLGLHSTTFSDRGEGNAQLNKEKYCKKAEKRPQVVKFG
jgi:hypothetical protein